MSKLYVFSTLTSDQLYVNHAESGNDLPAPVTIDGREGVYIAGGAGVANDRLVTPRGVVTEVTDAQADYLNANPVFQLHRDNGFIEISDKYADPEKVAAEMASRDGSAPLVPQDLAKEDLPAGSDEFTNEAPTTPHVSTKKKK